MKNLFLFCFVLLTIETYAQNRQGEEQFVNTFVKEWLASNGSKECAIKFLDIDNRYLNDNEQKDLLFSWFSLFGKNINEEINRNKGIYQVIPHSCDNSIIEKFNLKIADYSGVYYLVSRDKILTSIVVKNNKIISFCPMLNQGTKTNKAWLINEQPVK